jgi:uncharacterized membrane protein (UPF0127 family)
MTPDRPRTDRRSPLGGMAGWRELFLATVLVVASAAGCKGAPSGPIVELTSERGTVGVPVELALTREQLGRGLMWRDDLASDAGMLFVFGDDVARSFWMKNTPLPLDIIFIDAEGKVVNVAENTTPFSTAPIRSAGPARYVLEVNAGFARRHGIVAGSKVTLPKLPASEAGK